jgi:hypothetical protein
MARSGAVIFLLPGYEATAACMLYRKACQVLIEPWILSVYEKIRDFDNADVLGNLMYRNIEVYCILICPLLRRRQFSK